jgi:hypothetical protein
MNLLLLGMPKISSNVISLYRSFPFLMRDEAIAIPFESKFDNLLRFKKYYKTCLFVEMPVSSKNCLSF